MTTLLKSPINEPSPPRMTEEEFLAWCDEDIRAEWVDGEVFVMSPVNLDHSRLFKFLLTLLDGFVQFRDLGEILGSEYLIRMPNKPRMRLPDILFVAKERLHLLKRTYLDGAPDLIVEIVSP